jgi:CRISPR system Cascade subunit CasD
LHYAARLDRTGTVLVDYQTVDLGQRTMDSDLAWTTDGVLERRKGGGAADGTHIRYRHYVADSVVTVACSVAHAEGEIDFDLVVNALQRPARPLFLGRKCCPPSVQVFLGTARAGSLREALEATPRIGQRGDDADLKAVWPRTAEDVGPGWPRVEDRDWENSIHVGKSIYVLGTVDPPPATPTTGGGAS